MKRKFGHREPRHEPRNFHLAPQKSLGQHFLRDEHVLLRIVHETESLVSEASCRVCDEIGPGEGVLTRRFLEAGWSVHAVEKDPRSVEGLEGSLCKQYSETFSISRSDILKWDPPVRKELRGLPFCVGNLPYYITSDILLWFAARKDRYAAGLFMVQKEVAERIQARPGTKDYGRLSVRLQLCFECQMLFVVPSAAFSPPPKVDSAIIRLVPNGFSFLGPEDVRSFESLTATLFSARRKMLRRALASTLDSYFEDEIQKEELFWKPLRQHNVFPETRPDAIAPEAILALHRLLRQMRN